MPEHLCLLHFPDLPHSRLYLNLHFCVRHPLSVPVFSLVTTSATHPSLMPLPQGVAAIVVPNKVYGITDLWNWIFSLHQSSGITGLRPGASGHNWPVTELLFSDCTLKVGRQINRLMCQQLWRKMERQADSLYLCMYLAIKWILLSQTAFWLLRLDFSLSCRPLSHAPPPSVLTTFDCVWSKSNLMNLLIFLAWHPDASQISTSKVAQFFQILKIWPLVKQLILMYRDLDCLPHVYVKWTVGFLDPPPHPKNSSLLANPDQFHRYC